MQKIVQNIFEIPGEFLRVAKRQIIGPKVLPEEKNQQQAAAAAKKKLPGLIAKDQKQAAARISQIQQQLRKPLPELKQKPKFPPLAIRNMYNKSSQTGERKLGE
jgi:hypothetical protein